MTTTRNPVLNTRMSRVIAEGIWGKGSTRREKTNSDNAWYFTTIRHGGLILDAAALTQGQREIMSEFFTPEKGKVAIETDGTIAGIVTPYGPKSMRVAADASILEFEFFALEDHQDYPLTAGILGIGATKHLADPAFQEDCARALETRRLHIRIQEEQFEKAVLLVASEPDLIPSGEMAYGDWLDKTGRTHWAATSEGQEADSISIYNVVSAVNGSTDEDAAKRDRILGIVARSEVRAQPGLQMDHEMDFDDWIEETGLDVSAWGVAPFHPGTADLYDAALSLFERSRLELKEDEFPAPGM